MKKRFYRRGGICLLCLRHRECQNDNGTAKLHQLSSLFLSLCLYVRGARVRRFKRFNLLEIVRFFIFIKPSVEKRVTGFQREPHELVHWSCETLRDRYFTPRMLRLSKFTRDSEKSYNCREFLWFCLIFFYFFFFFCDSENITVLKGLCWFSKF